jgi:signal transduction histidine kinase
MATRHEDTQAEDLLAFLAKASRVLASSLDYEMTLAGVATLAVPRLADWCFIEIEEDGELRQIAAAHADPIKARFAQELRRQYPPSKGAPRGCWHVLQTGSPELHADVADAVLEVVAHDEAHLEGLRHLGLRSSLSVPLLARDRAIGILILCMADSGRRLSLVDVPAAEELASRVAVAIENARLYLAERRARREAERAAEEAQRAVHAREDMLAIVSHDLRNLLNVVAMGSAVIVGSTLEGEQGERVRRHAQRIARAAEQMTFLIRDLLDAASIESGHLSVALAAHETEDVVTESIEHHAPLAAERSLEIQRETAPSRRILCDRSRVLQVFSNLLGNAIKFTQPGGTITVRARPEEEAVRFEIADTGPGIAGDKLPYLFERYWKGNAAQGGAGLGLFIAKGIVDAHGGTLGVSSVPGAGSTFYFTIPMAP